MTDEALTAVEATDTSTIAVTRSQRFNGGNPYRIATVTAVEVIAPITLRGKVVSEAERTSVEVAFTRANLPDLRRLRAALAEAEAWLCESREVSGEIETPTVDLGKEHG